MKVISLILSICMCYFVFSCTAESDQIRTAKFGEIPASAEIIFHIDNLIYVMDADGGNLTQITFENKYTIEHVSLSFDRKKMVINYFSDPTRGGETSKMRLFDLEKNTEGPFLEHFDMAGNGGVDWDENGYIYFAGVEKYPFSDPTTIAEFQANAGANEIYRAKYDGSGLLNLTQTSKKGEADVSVSGDSQLITYMSTDIEDPYKTFTEIWKRKADGNAAELLFTGGQDRVSSVHDPEFSPDNRFVVFSQVNNSVEPVFPDNPLANTAHDIIKLDLLSGLAQAITKAGPISIAPDWKHDKVLFLEITDKADPPHAGIAIVNVDGTGYKLLKNGSNIGKWIAN